MNTSMLPKCNTSRLVHWLIPRGTSSIMLLRCYTEKERVRESVCDRERECVCERDSEREKGGRKIECVSVSESRIESKSKSKCESESERDSERERVRVCVCVWVCV